MLAYIWHNEIAYGPVFITRRGNPLNRSAIFRSIQEICRAAGIPEEKGNPGSLRRLYKDTWEDIRGRLADLQWQMYDQMLAMEQEAIDGYARRGPGHEWESSREKRRSAL